ncbi:MAG: class I SAM-dependent methyltransferase [Thermoplasmata archaeon]
MRVPVAVVSSDTSGNSQGLSRVCENLLEKWDPLFSKTVDPARTGRMDAILGDLYVHFRGEFRVLDLGCGPGPLTAQILRRFPKCRVVALDTDPVLLRVGAVALNRYSKRLRWVLADLREKDWVTDLPVRRFDAVVSSLALHWLEKEEIRALYSNLRGVLRPGGLFLNGDFLPSSRSKGRVGSPGRAVERSPSGVRPSLDTRDFKRGWTKWWEALSAEPSMSKALSERQIRMPGTLPPRRTTGPKIPVSLETHQRALRDAGFRQTSVSWQARGMCVLLGIR